MSLGVSVLHCVVVQRHRQSFHGNLIICEKHCHVLDLMLPYKHSPLREQVHVTETSEFLWTMQHKQTLQFESIKSDEGFYFLLFFLPHQYIFPFIHPVTIQFLLASPSWSSVAVLTQALRRGDNSEAGGPKFMPADDRLPNSKNSLPRVVTAFSTRNPKPAVKISRIPSNREGCDNSADTRVASPDRQWWLR